MNTGHQNIKVIVPMLTIEAYAELTNQKVAAVQHQIRATANRGPILPTIQPSGKNGTVFINMVALAELCAKAEQGKDPHNRVEWMN